MFNFCKLYLIEILHQTTTLNPSVLFAIELYLIEILHQTTTLATVSPFLLRCILSKFYIKPQLYRHLLSPDSVVSYRNSTSNHNYQSWQEVVYELYLIEILHQTTTYPCRAFSVVSCILSKFYIKPQLCHGACYYTAVVSYRNSTSNHNWMGGYWWIRKVVSYRNSTSNHNFASFLAPRDWLYLIEILHQTTTAHVQKFNAIKLYLIEILHQTTTCLQAVQLSQSCILSKFYIKPQPISGCVPNSWSCILSKFYIKPQLGPHIDW